MRKKDLLLKLWLDLSIAYRDARIELVKAIQAAKTPEDGLKTMDQYNAVNLNFLLSMGFASEDSLRNTFLNGIVELKRLGYVKLPIIDRRVRDFLDGKAKRPFE